MMSEMGDKLLTLENPMCFDNGKTVAFTIKTVDGKKLRINCPISELGDIFSFPRPSRQSCGRREDFIDFRVFSCTKISSSDSRRGHWNCGWDTTGRIGADRPPFGV